MSLRYFLGVTSIFFVLMVVAGCGGGGNSSPATGQVMGNVYISAGSAFTLTSGTNTTPAAGAVISVQGTSLSTTVKTDGSFLLNAVPTGSRTLNLMQSGLQPATVTLTVAANKAVNISSGTLTSVARLWTILIYLDADNDLAPEAILNLQQMESVPNSNQVSIVVQYAKPNNSTSNETEASAHPA